MTNAFKRMFGKNISSPNTPIECPALPTSYRAHLIAALSLELGGASNSDSNVIDLTEYITRGQLVGSGGFGDIYQASWKAESLKKASASLPHLAIKVMRVVRSRDESHKAKVVKQLKREIRILQELAHPHILPLIGIACLDGDRNFPAIITPWMENGTVVEYTKENRTAPVAKFMVDMMRGLDYLHNFDPQIIHGDMKGSNVLIDQKGNLYICDFGLSRMVEDTTLWNTSATHAGGSTRWTAPELMTGQEPKPTKESDIYSYSMTCYEIVTGNIPFANLRSDAAVLFAVTTRNERPKRPPVSQISDAIWNIITWCWESDPTRRPSSTAVLDKFDEQDRQNHTDWHPIQRFTTSEILFEADPFSKFSGLACSPTESTVATARLHNLSIDNYLSGHQDQIAVAEFSFSCVAFSRSGELLVAGGNHGISVWQLSGQMRKLGPYEGWGTSFCYAVAFSPDNRWIISGSSSGVVRKWDVNSGTAVLRYRIPAAISGSESIRSVTISHCGRKIAAQEWHYNGVVMWDFGQPYFPVLIAKNSPAYASAIQFSPHSSILAAGYLDGSLLLWDTDTYRATRIIQLHTDFISCISFSSDGRMVATGSNDQTVRVFTNDGGVVGVIDPSLAGHGEPIKGIGFSSNDKRIISASANTVRSWHAQKDDKMPDFTSPPEISELRTEASREDLRSLAKNVPPMRA